MSKCAIARVSERTGEIQWQAKATSCLRRGIYNFREIVRKLLQRISNCDGAVRRAQSRCTQSVLALLTSWTIRF